MGNFQSLGKVKTRKAPGKQRFLPRFVGDEMAQRSVDWWLMSEDLPDPGNRVLLQEDRIRLHYTANNMAGHKRLTAKARSLMSRIGFKINIAKHMGGLSVSHQCGTVRFGNDP